MHLYRVLFLVHALVHCITLSLYLLMALLSPGQSPACVVMLTLHYKLGFFESSLIGLYNSAIDLHAKSFITHADGSHVSIAIIRLCDSVCPYDKPKRLKLLSRQT